ncbi:MAG: hypothetical protein FWG30_03310 [Eubacteriaceae bacterium]|nr:hypothetical protein [Eubacteriaceae bacterium]
MKKALTFVLALLLALTQLAACSSSSPPATNSGNEDEIVEIDADAWWVDYYWKLEAKIAQNEEFGSLVNQPGMYADYVFDITMTGGGDPINDPNMTVEGIYYLQIESTIKINTDEAADRLLSELLGETLSDMGLGISVDLAGVYEGGIPYYLDGNGMPVKPEYDQNYEPIWPEGKTDASLGANYVNKTSKDWQSPIKNKNGTPMQPAEGSYLMFDAFTMKYTGSSSHELIGSFSEDLAYDIYLYIVIEPAQPGIIDLGDFNAKVYLNLVTSENHEIWLEGEGTLTLVEEWNEQK